MFRLLEFTGGIVPKVVPRHRPPRRLNVDPVIDLDGVGHIQQCVTLLERVRKEAEAKLRGEAGY